MSNNKEGWKTVIISILTTALLTAAGAWFSIGQGVHTNQQIIIKSVQDNTTAINKLNDTLGELVDIRQVDRENFLGLESRVNRLEEYHPKVRE